MRLLDRAALRLLDRVRLVVRATATSSDQGGHRSPALAQGQEFADHRQYVPGDDVRRVDWKAFARHRQLVVRQFIEDRDVRVYILVDTSGSMTRGAPAKVEVAKRIAAAFSYAGTKDFDRVRVLPFSSDMDVTLRAVRSRGEMPGLDAQLADAGVGGETKFPEVVRDFARRYPQRGLAIVVSDLMAPDGWEDGLRLLGGLGHQLVLVRVACAEDDAPDMRGEVELVDSESGQTVPLRMTPALIEAYRAEVREHVARCREACRRAGGRSVVADVSMSSDALVRVLLGGADAGAQERAR